MGQIPRGQMEGVRGLPLYHPDLQHQHLCRPLRPLPLLLGHQRALETLWSSSQVLLCQGGHLSLLLARGGSEYNGGIECSVLMNYIILMVMMLTSGEWDDPANPQRWWVLHDHPGNDFSWLSELPHLHWDVVCCCGHEVSCVYPKTNSLHLIIHGPESDPEDLTHSFQVCFPNICLPNWVSRWRKIIWWSYYAVHLLHPQVESLKCDLLV